MRCTWGPDAAARGRKSISIAVLLFFFSFFLFPCRSAIFFLFFIFSFGPFLRIAKAASKINGICRNEIKVSGGGGSRGWWWWWWCEWSCWGREGCGGGVLNAALRRYGPIRKIRRGKHVASISPFVRKHFEPLGSTCIQSDHRSVRASAWPAAAAEYSGTDRYSAPPPHPLRLPLPLCVPCHIYGAEVSLTIGGCSWAPHCCTKQHFHDKLVPQQICSAAAAGAAAVQLIYMLSIYIQMEMTCVVMEIATRTHVMPPHHIVVAATPRTKVIHLCDFCISVSPKESHFRTVASFWIVIVFFPCKLYYFLVLLGVRLHWGRKSQGCWQEWWTGTVAKFDSRILTFLGSSCRECTRTNALLICLPKFTIQIISPANKINK